MRIALDSEEILLKGGHDHGKKEKNFQYKRSVRPREKGKKKGPLGGLRKEGGPFEHAQRLTTVIAGRKGKEGMQRKGKRSLGDKEDARKVERGGTRTSKRRASELGRLTLKPGLSAGF